MDVVELQSSCGAKRKQALLGRNHAGGSPGGRVDALKIPARRAEYSLKENATSLARVSLAAKNEVTHSSYAPRLPRRTPSPPNQRQTHPRAPALGR
jgi:hypothetical protein